jgi:hypothetical protein
MAGPLFQGFDIDGLDPTDPDTRVGAGTLAGEPGGAGLTDGADLVGPAGHGTT